MLNLAAVVGLQLQFHSRRCHFFASRPGLKILLAAFFCALFQSGVARAETQMIRVGVLAFGTVNWELDSLQFHGLDQRHGVQIAVTRLSGKNAAAVALQGGEVDAIVSDWIWVSRQRSSGADYSFVPHSLAAGGLMVRPDAGIGTLNDLRDKKLGIAGGPVDKSWLMLRAYAQKTIGTDLKRLVEANYAAPPLLNKIMLRGDIPAALNFWHYSARLKAAGMTELISVENMLPVLGVKRKPPLIGWVFSERWAAENPQTIAGFLRALRDAKQILGSSDTEWDRLRPLTRAQNDRIQTALRDAYRAGIPTSFNQQDIAAARQLFATLAKYGGRDLVGDSNSLAPGTFWAGYRY